MARRPRKSATPAAPAAPWVADSIQNVLSGLGTGKDKSTGAVFVFTELNQQQLEAAYRSDWIARKVVDVPAQDATREWRSWQATNKDIGAIEDAEDQLGLRRKVKAAMQYGRLYGGGALLLGVDQGNLQDEIKTKTLRKGSLKFVHAVSRYELSAGEIDWDLASPYYGEPKYYQRTQGDMARVHPSRVVRFMGNTLPNPALAVNGWSDSVLQTVADAITSVGTVIGTTAQLVHESKIDVIRIPGLDAGMANKDYQQRLQNRFSSTNVLKSIFSTILLDKEEEWQRVTAAFAGLPDLLKMYLLIASGACDIPATRMLGQSPAGLSATGESDLRNYYDGIADDQNTDLRNALQRLDDVLIASALGGSDTGVFYEWNSLWQLDATQKATIAKTYSDVFKTDNDSGLLPSDIMRKARVNQLIEAGTYPGLEGIIEEAGGLDGLEEPTPQPAAPAPGAPGTEPVPPAPVTGEPAQSDPNSAAPQGGPQAVEVV